MQWMGVKMYKEIYHFTRKKVRLDKNASCQKFEN